MAEAQADVRISDDKQNVSVTFLPKSGATGTLNLTPDQLTALIQGLGKVRRQMVAGKGMPARQAVPLKRWSIRGGTYSQSRWWMVRRYRFTTHHSERSGSSFPAIRFR